MSRSSTVKLTWKSSLKELYPRKMPQTAEAIYLAGIETLEDLIWIIPNKIQIVPDVQPFSKILEGELFRGQGEVVNVQSKPNFRSRGKRGILLQNLKVTVKDQFSQGTFVLNWFNTYPSMIKKFKDLKHIIFLGEVQMFMGNYQMNNPEVNSLEDVSEVETSPKDFLIRYPTISGVATNYFKKIMDKIPQYLWDYHDETLPPEIVKERDLISLEEAFKIIHGKVSDIKEWNQDKFRKAVKRLAYEEFLHEQVKIQLRRKKKKRIEAPILKTEPSAYQVFKKLLPYELTEDQDKVLEDIKNDFHLGAPMMRLIQGDVGCGKTTVAFLSALIAMEQGYQVALMAPTESLAIQHYDTFTELMQTLPFRVQALVGSQKIKEKKQINLDLKEGRIDLIIGTHALFQKSVEFKKLGFCIIDEQHKFGVNQRIALVSKGEGTHCLIMTATPIPRSLSLTQYGDLDVSTIRIMPAGRKAIQSKIVPEDKFEKFLSFLYTRVKNGEQAYIVTPAIEENPDIDFQNVENATLRFRKFFKDLEIAPLHGKVAPEEKTETFRRFLAKEIDILVSTSVVEVGINNLNATVMAVMNPERFGLSSLHQLRGRVGRGERPGFFFMILEQDKMGMAMKRLSIIEKTLDGFQIAEADLEIRGQGDLFGTAQSGEAVQRKVANIIKHQDLLFSAKQDLEKLTAENHHYVQKLREKYANDKSIYSTI